MSELWISSAVCTRTSLQRELSNPDRANSSASTRACSLSISLMGTSSSFMAVSVPVADEVLSFQQFAMVAIIACFVVGWTVVLVSRFDRYTRNRKRFRFTDQFEHIGQERAEQALAERMREEARAAADRIRIAEDIR